MLGQPGGPQSHPSGGASAWILTVSAVVAVAVLLLLWSRSAGPRPLTTVQAPEALAVLQKKFQAAITHQRDVAYLLPEASAIVDVLPDSADARVTLAQILILLNRSPEAYEQLVGALKSDPDRADVHDLAGTLALKQERPEDAQRYYLRAIELDPDHGEYRLHLAQSQLEQLKADAARQTLLEALRIDSSLHAAHGMLSDLYGSEQLLDLAIVHIRRAIDRVPGGEPEAAYLRRYAQLLCRVDQPGQALAVLRRLPVEKHLDPEVMGEMAACWDALGQPEKAARQYEQALRLQPSDEGAAAAAAEWYLRAQDEMSARRMIEQLRHINPASTRLPLLRKRLEQVGAAGQP